MDTENNSEAEDELDSEYNFATLRGGIKGKYSDRYKAGANLVLLAPDVAEAFPTQEAVNDAFRLLIKIAKTSVTHDDRSKK